MPTNSHEEVPSFWSRCTTPAISFNSLYNKTKLGRNYTFYTTKCGLITLTEKPQQWDPNRSADDIFVKGLQKCQNSIQVNRMKKSDKHKRPTILTVIVYKTVTPESLKSSSDWSSLLHPKLDKQEWPGRKADGSLALQVSHNPIQTAWSFHSNEREYGHT